MIVLQIDKMSKLRELEIFGHILRNKQVTSADLVKDLGINSGLAARWLGYFHAKGWLTKQLLPHCRRRFVYRLSPQAEKILRKVRSHDNTLEKVLWFGLGALVSIALTKAIKGSAQKGKQSKEKELKEKRSKEVAG